MLAMNDPCYALIVRLYGDRRAQRSGAPLMKHIEDGLRVLDALEAPEVALQAFCLHPIVQEDATLLAATRPDGLLADATLPAAAVVIATEYRHVANAFLSKDVDLVGAEPKASILPEVQLLLIADKVQNRFDFERHHAKSHPRSGELARYFQRWLAFLGVDDERYAQLAANLRTHDDA